jgi:hypothetical protein
MFGKEKDDGGGRGGRGRTSQEPQVESTSNLNMTL